MIPSDYLERHHAVALARLRDMVRLATVNPPGDRYGEMADYLHRRCGDLGMKSTIHRVPDDMMCAAGPAVEYPRYNVVARLDVGAEETVHFNAHYDVVPVGEGWKSGAPFSGRERGEWLYGRGSGDMKGSMAALLAAIEAVVESGASPAVNVECSFTADEETGGLLGAGYVVRQGLVQADYAIVCEGACGTNVGCGHNGVLWVELELAGRSAHASNPQRGVNAFESMVELVHNLQGYKRGLASAARRYRDFNGQERNPTVSLGGVFGGDGQKVNTVPGNARFTVDRRLVPGERITRVERDLCRAVSAAARRCGARYECRSLLRIEPCVVDSQHPLPQAFGRSVRSVRHRASGFRTTTGFTDLHYFAVDGGLPGIGYGVDGQNAHAADERVRTRDVLSTARIYADFMLRGLAG